jgi:hypothetical protein
MTIALIFFGGWNSNSINLLLLFLTN